MAAVSGTTPCHSDYAATPAHQVPMARQEYVDHVGDWARASEVSDTGCILVRPDHHVAWRADELTEDPKTELTRVMNAILAR